MTTLRRTILPLVLLLSLGTQLGNGCVSDDGGAHGDDRPDEYRPQRYEDDDRRPNRIPRSADVVGEGYEKLLWRADMNGRYYVYDVTRDRIIFDAPISRGQELYLDAKRDRVSVDGKDVPNLDVKRDSFHRIYFTASRNGAGYAGPQRPPPRDDDGDSRDPNLPRGAERLVSGRGNLAIHAAPADGTVYVYDDTARRIVHQSDLKRGNSFQIFPAKDYVNVNSKRAADVRLSADGRYSLYFVKRN
jgi:hypothetical protein